MAWAAATAAVALAVWCPLPAASQMVTPLQGQGYPGPNTTEVFLSVYLDRLLHGGVCEGDLRWAPPAWCRHGMVPSAHGPRPRRFKPPRPAFRPHAGLPPQWTTGRTSTKA